LFYEINLVSLSLILNLTNIDLIGRNLGRNCINGLLGLVHELDDVKGLADDYRWQMRTNDEVVNGDHHRRWQLNTKEAMYWSSIEIYLLDVQLWSSMKDDCHLILTI
jgi:hypothetical protein